MSARPLSTTSAKQNYMIKAALAGSAPVLRSKEFERIKALPRRSQSIIPEGFFEPWRRTKSGLGNFDLRFEQAQALYELTLCRGLMASLALGTGKTGIGLLAGAILGVDRAVFLVPADLYAQVLGDYKAWNEHWQLLPLRIEVEDPPEPGLYIVKHTDLSSKLQCKYEILERIKPQLIAIDEAQSFARRNIRTKRLKRAQRLFKPKRLHLSGTFMDRSIREPAALSYVALGEGSPYPREYETLESWAWALDDVALNAPPGVLTELVDAPIGAQVSLDQVRDGFRRRVAETPGFVVSKGDYCGSNLVFKYEPLLLPKPVDEALKQLRRLWRRPDGVDLVSPLEFHRCARTLALGFYLRWTEVPPRAWLAARSAWNQELNEFLARGSRSGLDSPALVMGAAARGELEFETLEHWLRLEPSYKPKGEAVFLDYFAVENAAQWARTHEGIVWADHPAFGEAVAVKAELPWYGGGTKASYDILNEKATRSIVASVQAHHRGKNLQAFSEALITTPRNNAARMGQTIGRIHRSGQKAETVSISFYLHTDEYIEALKDARRLAWVLQKTGGELQKLVVGTYATGLWANGIP